MTILGAHMSIAGGFYRAVEAARDTHCDCVQIFSKNNNQWQAKPIVDDQISLFRQAMRVNKIGYPLIHTSYLINLASPQDPLWSKSIDAMIVEVQRAAQLEIPSVVLHPGAYTTSSEEAGLKRISQALREVERQTIELNVACLLETTAGQGSNLGHRFEHLAAILDDLQNPARFGICFDTCHVFAAGYPLESANDYRDTLRELDRTVGCESLRAIHLNDSKQPLASRKDRHEHIGRGCLGLEPFRHLVNDSRFRKVPMYLETPKGEHEGRSWDEINLETVRNLAED